MNRVVLLLLLALGGCASYQQPSLPADQMAKLSFEQKGGGLFTDGSVALKKIDDKLPSPLAEVVRHRSPINLSPGKHSLDLTYVVGTYNGKASLWFVAEPGISYLVRGEAVGYEFRIWIEEELSGRLVGGMKGSDDEPK